MKKILLSLFVVLLSFTCVKINTYASSTNILKKLVIVMGSTDSLSYPGYELLETNINYFKEGSYFAKYKEDITDRIFTREIEVISEETLVNSGVKCIRGLEEFTIDDNIIKRVIIPNGNLIVKIKDGNIVLSFIYQNETIDKVIDKESKFEFVDIEYDDVTHNIYVCGNIVNETTDILLLKYNLKGEQVLSKTLIGSNVDSVTSLAVGEENLVITGTTYSSDFDFAHTAYSEDSYVMTFDKDSLERLNYLNLGKEGIDRILKVIYTQDIYLVEHYFVSGINFTKIIKLDKNLELLDEKLLNLMTLTFTINMASFNNDIYYFCSNYDETLNDDKTLLYKIDENLKVTLLDEYYDEFSRGCDLSVSLNEVKLLYTSFSENDNYPTYLRVIGNEKKQYSLDNRIYKFCYFNSLGNLDLVYNNKLKSYSATFAYAKTLGSKNTESSVTPIMMCNNHQVDYNKDFSETYFNKNIFGTYSLAYYYNFDFFDLIYKKEIKVLSNVNISEDNLYTKGLTLNFLGQATLNNENILTDYKIMTPGKYCLIIRGNNGAIEKYNFEVIGLDNEKITLKNILLEVKEQDLEKKDLQKLNLTHSTFTNNIVSKNYVEKIWYIIIPILTFLLTSVTLFSLGRKLR